MVYLADENAEYRKQVKENFKNAGVKAKIFSFDGEEKLMHALDQTDVMPDVIFLTFSLENNAALSCLRWIRIKQNLSGVPVFVFSPFTYLKDISEAFESGANLFIPQSVFFADGQKILRILFKDKWYEKLLSPDRQKFVLKSDIRNTDKLTLSYA